MAHTKEPWKVDPNYPRDIQAGGCEVSTAFADYQQGEEIRLGGKIAATEAEARANARRIVACVNALAGYNPDAVADVVAALEQIEGFSEVNGMTRIRMRKIAKNALTRLRSPSDE